MKQIALIKDKNGRITDFAEITNINNESELKRYEILRDTAKTEKKEITYDKDKFFIVYNYYMNRFLLQAQAIDNEEKFFDRLSWPCRKSPGSRSSRSYRSSNHRSSNSGSYRGSYRGRS